MLSLSRPCPRSWRRGLLSPASVLTAFLALALTAEAQIPSPRVSRFVLPTATPARTVVAFDPSGDGWVAARGARFRARGIPEEMRGKLDEYVEEGKAIDAVAFTPDGGWTVVAGAANWTRNVGGAYYETLQDLGRQGKRVRAVAFNPADWRRKRGFVIVYDGGFAAQEVPDELRRKLAEFVRGGKSVDAVAFTPDGGWTVAADGASWTRNVGSARLPGRVDYFDRITALVDRGGQRAHGVAFVPTDFARVKGYVVVTSAGFEAQDAPAALTRALERDLGLQGITRGDGAADGPERARFTARVKTAEIDLRTLRVNRPTERADEPYLVMYRFRGRLHDRNRIFIHEMKMWKDDPDGHILYTGTGNGVDAARAGRRLDLPQSYSRIVFEDLQPFEVYGVFVVLAEQDGTHYTDQESAYERASRTIVDRFDRALPLTGAALDYDLLTKDNVRRIVETSLGGLRDAFGRSLAEQVRRVLEREFGGGNSDDILGFQPIFFINAPDPENDEAREALILAEHLATPDCVLEPGAFRSYFRGNGLQADLTSDRGVYVIPEDHTYVLEGLHRLYESR